MINWKEEPEEDKAHAMKCTENPWKFELDLNVDSVENIFNKVNVQNCKYLRFFFSCFLFFEL